MLSVSQHGFGELPLLSIDLSGAAFEDKVGKADDRIEWGTQLVRHVRQEFALELSGALKLDIFDPKRLLVTPALLEHRGAVETYNYLISQNLKQPQVVIAERPAVAPVVHAHGSNGHSGRAQRDDCRGLELDWGIRWVIAPRVAIHIIGYE